MRTTDDSRGDQFLWAGHGVPAGEPPQLGQSCAAACLDTYCRREPSDLPRKCVEPITLEGDTAVRTRQEPRSPPGTDWRELLSPARPTERSGGSDRSTGYETHRNRTRTRTPPPPGRRADASRASRPPSSPASSASAAPRSTRWLRHGPRASPRGSAAKPHPGPKPRLTAEQTQGAGRAPAPGGQGPRLAQRPVERPPGRRDDPPPLRRRVPHRARPQDHPAAAALEQPEAAEEGQAAQRREDRPLKGSGTAPDRRARPRSARPTWSSSTSRASNSTPVVRRTYAPRGQTPIVEAWHRKGRISAISAVTVSPVRQAARPVLPAAAGQHQRPRRGHGGLPGPVAGPAAGPMTILWDQSKIHERSGVVKAYLAKHPEIVTEDFPGYAPDANPDEGVWGWTKYHRLPNFAPEDTDGAAVPAVGELSSLSRSGPTCWPRSSGTPRSRSDCSRRLFSHAGLSNAVLRRQARVGREVGTGTSTRFRCGRPSRQNRPTGLLAAVLQDQPHRVGVGQAQLQRPLHGPGQVPRAGPLQEPEHLDEPPRPRPAELGLEPAAEHAEADRQFPALQRCREVQRPGLALEQGQVVDRVVGDPLAAPAPPVLGHHAVPGDDPDRIHLPASKQTSDSEATDRGADPGGDEHLGRGATRWNGGRLGVLEDLG